MESPWSPALFSGSKAADTGHVNTAVNGVCLGARPDGKTVGVGGRADVTGARSDSFLRQSFVSNQEKKCLCSSL